MAQVEISEDARHEPGRLFDVLVLVSSVAVAFTVRAWALHARGVVSYDQTYYYILGTNLFSGNGFSLNGLPHTAFPPLYPLLVGFASLFAPGIGAATSAVSAVAGALVPLPVYFLARDILGRRMAAVAAALSALWPALFFYSAGNVTYSQRLYAGSEPLFVTLAAAGILFFWLAGSRRRWFHAALAGGFCGLAALVRNEAVIMFVFLCAWLVVDLLARRRARRWRSAALPAAAVAGLAAVLLPFLIHVHGVTDRVNMGAKLSNFMRTRPTLWEWVETGSAKSYSEVHCRLNDDATAMKDAYWGVSDWQRRQEPPQGALGAGIAVLASPDWRWLRVFGGAFTGGALPLVQRYAWPFVIIGLLALFAEATRRRFLLLFVFLLLAQLLLGVSIFVLARFELPLLVPIAVFTALGLDVTGRFFVRVARLLRLKRAPIETAIRFAPALLVLILMLRSGVQANRLGNLRGRPPGAISSTRADALVAARLEAELPPNSTLMVNKPWIAVWAGLDWRVCPVDTPERILKYALANRIDYALLGAWQIPPPDESSPLRPYLAGQFTEGGKRYLFDFTQHASGSASAGSAGPQAPVLPAP